MADVAIPPDRVHDPFEKRVPGLGLGRDPERTPMPWSPAPHAGFSTAEPWLPVGPDYATHNVASELRNHHSMLVLYRKLIHLRNFSPMLQHGTYQPLELDHPHIFGYLRAYRGHGLAVLLNFSDQTAEFHTDLGRGALLYSTHADAEGLPLNLETVTLRPNEGYVVTLL
jgi:alpha-glucosidase